MNGSAGPWTVPSLCRLMVIVLTVSCSWLVATDANSGYLVAVPSALRPGTGEVVSVTILKPSEPILVEAKLFSKSSELLIRTGHEIFGKGTLTLKIPRNVKGKCTLKICGNCVAPREGSYTFYNSTVIEVLEKGTSVFIQTDKPIYKPGQRVYANIITTDPDLRPVNEHYFAYIEDPLGSRMIQWKDLRPPCCGVANVSYPISDQPVLGLWRVVVRLQGQVYNRTFEIQKYVLPRYDVIIDPPRFIRDWRKCETVYIRARYTFGKRVDGVLSLTTAVKGVGYYKESTGPTIRLARQIHGVASMNVCIHQMVDGLWDAGDHFRGLLHIEAAVTTPDGATVKVSDSSCPVTKHLIDLEFTRNTRPHFKPGLPYKGRLRVTFPDGSAAENITVRVQADVNGENFVSRDYVSKGGLINFGMPALPQAAQAVWLEAKVMKIESDVVHDHYFPTYMSIGSWYSPSKCHTLIEGKPGAQTVGQVAKFYVHSTCPCNFTMYHEVMSRGNLVHSGIHIARHVRKRSVQFEEIGRKIDFDDSDEHMPPSQAYGDMKICTIFVKFVVTHEMAPISRLLVYYVRENGEGVADSFMFRVKPKYKNHLSVGVSKRVATPGEDLKLHVSTSSESHVCVSAVDKSVHLLRPDFQLTSKDVFAEIENYDLTVDTGTDVHWWVRPRTLRRRPRRSALWWTAATAKDAHYAFEEVGLLVMTDTVRLHFRQGVGAHTGPIYHRPGPGYYQVASMGRPWQDNNFKPHTTTRQRKRSFFPETWIWRCFNASTDTVVSVKAPDTITTWQLEGLSLSSDRGLALADPVQLRTYKAFFIDFKLPYSVVRGEQVKIPLTVYNYLHFCVRVHLKIVSPEGVVVVPTADTEKLCVGAEESQTVTSIFVYSGLGHHQITAEANAYEDSRCCSGSYSDVTEDQPTVASDHVTNKVLCEPEGVLQRYVHSVFFCPNERIHLSTPNKYEFQYVRKHDDIKSVTFSARAHNDIRVSLSKEPHDNANMFEIVIGGWSNSQSWIAVGKEGRKLNIIDSKDIVSNDEFRNFWVSWSGRIIQVGDGEDVTNDTVLLEVDTGGDVVVTYLGFSTGWGSAGEFRIISDMEGSYGEVFSPTVPENTVPGSEKAVASLIGDVMGPSLVHLGHLVSLPHGCGEQNMVNFAPNTYVLTYLHRTVQLTPAFKQQAKEDLVKGYQRQLTYRRADGSYSAFGDRDPIGNMWLTAFVLRSFSQASQFIYVDDGEISNAIRWLISHQRRDGHFPQTGRLINKHIQGGVTSKITLTAFVTTALLEAGGGSKEVQMSLKNAQRYLESHLHLVDDPYTTALTAYTLTLLKSEHAGTLLKWLNHKATKRDGYTHWVLRDQLLTESEDEGRRKVLAAEVETAGYCLLTLTHHGRVAAALSVVKWLSQQRNSHGGFISTQDTCVALQSLSEYAALTHNRHLNLTVTVASTNMDLQKTEFVLTEENSAVLQTTPIPSIPEGLFVEAKGEGCALFQIDVSYNLAIPSEEPAFSIDIRLGQQRARPRNKTRRSRPQSPTSGGMDDFRVTIEICTRWRHHGSSNMAVMEVGLLSGFLPDESTLIKMMSHGHLKLKRYEIENKKVLFYFDEIRTSCLTCVSFETYRTYVVGKTQPVAVRVYDYYEPGYEATTFYNASNVGQLTEELCEDEICNEIKEDVDMPESDEDCNSIFGCYDPEPEGYGRCSCYRDCEQSGPRLCASDGRLHPNLCRLEVEACRQGRHLYVVPMNLCSQELHGGSGDVSDDDLATLPTSLPYQDESSNGSIALSPPVQDVTLNVSRDNSDVTDSTTEIPVLPAGGADGNFHLSIDSVGLTKHDENSEMGNQQGESPVGRRGSRVSGGKSGRVTADRKEVGQMDDKMAELNVPLVPIRDTGYQTAKSVGKDSQNAENETFGKSQNEQNDTLSAGDMFDQGFHAQDRKATEVDAAHAHGGNATDMEADSGQDDDPVGINRGSHQEHDETRASNVTDTDVLKGNSTLTSSTSTVRNGTANNDTHVEVMVVEKDNSSSAPNSSDVISFASTNLTEVDSTSIEKDGNTTSVFHTQETTDIDQSDTGQEKEESARLNNEFKLVEEPGKSSNITERWRGEPEEQQSLGERSDIT